MVSQGRPAGQPDFETRLTQTHIELGILVMRKRLVIAVYRAESVDSHQCMMAVVRPSARSPDDPMRRAAITQYGILRCGGRLLEPPAASRLHGYDHRGGKRALRLIEKNLAIISR